MSTHTCCRRSQQAKSRSNKISKQVFLTYTEANVTQRTVLGSKKRIDNFRPAWPDSTECCIMVGIDQNNVFMFKVHVHVQNCVCKVPVKPMQSQSFKQNVQSRKLISCAWPFCSHRVGTMFAEPPLPRPRGSLARSRVFPQLYQVSPVKKIN